MKRVLMIGSLLAVALGGFAYYQGFGRPTQVAVVELNAAALSTLQAEFNRASAETRVILLLSPT